MMHFFGKVVGIIVGFSLGGFFGSILGGIAGHFLIDLPKGREDLDKPINLSRVKDRIKTHIKYDFSLNKQKIHSSWVGKISCSFLGFLVLGFWGLIIGFIIGHAIDIIRRHSEFRVFSLENEEDPFSSAVYYQEAESVAFIQSMAGLCAKLAKVDGQVSRSEVNAFKSLFSVPPVILNKVGRTFNLAKESPSGYESYALQIKSMFGDSENIYKEIIKALFTVAVADERLTAEEISYISSVSVIFGLSDKFFDEVLSSYQSYNYSFKGNKHTLDDYEVLGISRNSSKTEVRKAWLKLLRENHPDRLTAKGASTKEIKTANERVAVINAAYERIIEGFK